MDNSWKVLLLIVSGEQRKNKHSSVIVITGIRRRYNFAKNYKGYASNETQVARDIHNALVQFFKLFPELRSNNFFVIDEFCGDEYIPAIFRVIKDYNIKI
ncbi:venom serine carboxypeptidase [Vespula squamosa]|uniref:Venom serine carboxypeptidase n=1 Tax=Vespula squamosa TaxID=30214 RepID=A0ABD1ZV59_VESSQ